MICPKCKSMNIYPEGSFADGTEHYKCDDCKQPIRYDYFHLVEGTKHDTDKIAWNLIDMPTFEKVVRVMMYGAAKYQKYNWKKGISFSRLYNASLRHITAFWKGEDLDTETGISHLAHAMCCLMFLEWHRENKKDLDDRQNKPKLKGTFYNPQTNTWE